MMGEHETEADSEPEIQIETVVLTGGICPRCGGPNLKSASLYEACDGDLTEQIRHRDGGEVSSDAFR